MINVLWVDDKAYDEKGEPTSTYYSVIDRGYDVGVFVQAYQNYYEALNALKSEPHKWNAIILDICDERAGHGETEDGFSEIYSEIEKFQVRNNQPEPYIFVYSGSDRFSTKEQQSIIRKRDYAKRVYVKGSVPELKEMFADIKNIVEVSPYYKIQQKYHDIFCAVKSLEWEKENSEILWKIIVSVENGKSDPSLLNDMRKLLEQMLSLCDGSTCITVACDITSPAEFIVTDTVSGWSRRPMPDIAKRPTIFIIGRSLDV